MLVEVFVLGKKDFLGKFGSGNEEGDGVCEAEANDWGDFSRVLAEGALDEVDQGHAFGVRRIGSDFFEGTDKR